MHYAKLECDKLENKYMQNFLTSEIGMFEATSWKNRNATAKIEKGVVQSANTMTPTIGVAQIKRQCIAIGIKPEIE